jgi:PAS domain S-box-containing protein
MMPELAPLRSEHFNFASALLDCIAQGTIVASASRQILVFNDTAEKLTGLRADELLGRPTSILPPVLQSLIDETIENKREVLARQIQLSVIDGTVMLQISTRLACGVDGDLLSVLVELQNVGQAQNVAANLEHLDRLATLGVLGAGVAHEIKNALVAVRTFVDLLQERNKGDELAQLVSREITRIDAVVRQVLRGAMHEEFTLAPLSLHELLNDAVNLLRHELQSRSIQLTLQLDASADCINGDERQLRHALLNLLMNALEAMTGPGRLGVATEEMEAAGRRHLVVIVSDTGSGIHAEHLPRLFTPFFTTKKEGTGLGLAITRRILQEHGGTISVQSEVNRGTRFQVTLPLL